MYFKFASVLSALLFLAIVGYVFNVSTHIPAAPTTATVSTTSHSKLTSSSTIAVPKPVVTTPKKPATTQLQASSSGATATRLNPRPSTTTHPETLKTSTDTFELQIESSVHILVNSHREKNGFSVLSYSEELAALARRHSADMLAQNYFSHEDPHGCEISCRVTSINYSYWAIGENIYMMSGFSLVPETVAEKIVSGWMNSPGHRANILSTSYTTEGIGIARHGDTVYATQNFAKPR